MPNKGWTKAEMPSQTGKVAIVTGATGGIGFETALGLAEGGATVIVAGRNDEKGYSAVERIKSEVLNANVVFQKVDLTSLSSVQQFCDRFHSQYEVLDILVNNAGTVGTSERETTEDGLELHFQTNYLSHFALTAHLLPALRKSNNPRVVHVSSGLHQFGNVNLKDLQYEKSKYSPYEAYKQSKLLNLLFMKELKRKSVACKWGVMSIGVHPGFIQTDIVTKTHEYGWHFKSLQWLNRVTGIAKTQTVTTGAISSLYAATAPEIKQGGFYGPTGFFEWVGPTGPVFLSRKAKNSKVAKKLWAISVSLTAVTW